MAAELERFPMSERMRATLSQAVDDAKARHHSEVSPEHILLALTNDPNVLDVLRAWQVDVAGLRSDVTAALDQIQVPTSEADIPRLSAGVVHVLEEAAKFARGRKAHEIGNLAVLHGILTDGSSPASRILRARGFLALGISEDLPAAVHEPQDDYESQRLERLDTATGDWEIPREVSPLPQEVSPIPEAWGPPVELGLPEPPDFPDPFSDLRASAHPPKRAGRSIVEAGQLVENIPRQMRVDIPVVVETRIARLDVEDLMSSMQGKGQPHRHKLIVTRAMSVQLRGSEGDFRIVAHSPETQWIENLPGLPAKDYASWRWTVTARERGKRHLRLVISARAVSVDGLAAETALSDQIIEVAVGINYSKVARRGAGWAVAAIAGGLLARFGDGAFDTVSAFVASFVS